LSIRQKQEQHNFFKTNIHKLFANYVLTIPNAQKTFHNFIEFNNQSNEMKSFLSSMYSIDTLESDMNIGFKGNPNMGSVVLNQFNHSEQFKEFATNFSTGDKIFIVSSIFGGTGASGFPLLLKTLRHNTEMPNHAIINNSNIGALSVLPYFNLKNDEESAINSETFISKTKAALHYYEKNVTKEGGVNSMYYLADREQNTYDNNPGSIAQKNKAHYLEMLGALGVVDFTHKSEGGFNLFECGLKNNTNEISFNDLDDTTNIRVKKNIIRYKFFTKYLEEQVTANKIGSLNWCTSKNINTDFLSTPFYIELKEFNMDFNKWLDEMKENKRSLQLFVDSHDGDIFSTIKEIKIESSFNPFAAKGYDIITNGINNSKPIDGKINDVFMQLNYDGIGKAINEKFKI
jgi:hypothetical protein